MLRELRPDWRIGRDWRRIWRDPAGFFGLGYRRCKCCNKSSSPAIGGCCCTSIPSTLHVTFANSGRYPEIDGQTFAITYGNPLHPLNTCQWTALLPAFCTGNPNPMTPLWGSSQIIFGCATPPASQAQLQYIFCDAQQCLFNLQLATASCSPLNWHFTSANCLPYMGPGGCSCGPIAGGAGPAATVTA